MEYIDHTSLERHIEKLHFQLMSVNPPKGGDTEFDFDIVTSYARVTQEPHENNLGVCFCNGETQTQKIIKEVYRKSSFIQGWVYVCRGVEILGSRRGLEKMRKPKSLVGLKIFASSQYGPALKETELKCACYLLFL